MGREGRGGGGRSVEHWEGEGYVATLMSKQSIEKGKYQGGQWCSILAPWAIPTPLLVNTGEYANDRYFSFSWVWRFAGARDQHFSVVVGSPN
jgi:hypothetical protein